MAERVLNEVKEVESIKYTLPNIHVFLYDLKRFGIENKIGDGAVLYPVADPSGTITAEIRRSKAKL